MINAVSQSSYICAETSELKREREGGRVAVRGGGGAAAAGVEIKIKRGARRTDVRELLCQSDVRRKVLPDKTST